MDKEEETRKQMLAGVKPLIENIGEFLTQIESMNRDLNQISMMLTGKGFALPKINNVAITYNNKMVDIFSLYRKKGVLLSDSCLKFIVVNHLVGIVGEAADCIDEYLKVAAKINLLLDKIKKKFILLRKHEFFKHKELLLSLSNEILRILEAYAKYDRMVFDFDLEKDILAVQESQRGVIAEIEAEMNPFPDEQDAYVRSCNDELDDLGIKKRMLCSAEQPKREKIPYNQLLDILYKAMGNTEERYEKQPMVAWTVLNRLSDCFELLKQANEENNDALYGQVSDRITSFNYLELTPWIVDIVGETLAFYGATTQEYEMLKAELVVLGFGDKIPEIEQNLASNKYAGYIETETRLLKNSPTKQFVIPDFKKPEKKDQQN